MLSPKEKHQKLIELQLSELSDANTKRLLEITVSMIKKQQQDIIEQQEGTAHKALIESYLKRETYTHKEVKVEGNRIHISRREVIKLPPKKNKRPRIEKISNSIDVKVQTVTDDKWLYRHNEGLRSLAAQHM